MAEIILQDGEPVEKAFKRFQRELAKSGTLSTLKNHSFFQSPSQKRRVKSKKARARLRKQERLARKFEPPDNKSGGWSHLSADIEHGWPVDLTAKPSQKRSSNSQLKKPELSEEPTDYAAAVFEYNHNGTPVVVLVKNAPDQNPKFNKGPARFGFPGGNVRPGEKPRNGAAREALEETGFELNPISDDDLLLVEHFGDHRKFFYKGFVAGGSPKKGEEILELEGQPIEALKELAKMGYLRTSHRKAFAEYLKKKRLDCIRINADSPVPNGTGLLNFYILSKKNRPPDRSQHTCCERSGNLCAPTACAPARLPRGRTRRARHGRRAP